jgi:mRNA-degrading endonuclease RelE of RelBE toxin-antitoxin system
VSVSGEPYRIEWVAPAKRALRRIPEKVATAVVEFIYGALAENPDRVGRPLRFELDGLHSAHRGDFRVVYRIDEPRRTVYIHVIGHRSDVYRRS